MAFDCQNAAVVEVRDLRAILVERVEHGRRVEEARRLLPEQAEAGRVSAGWDPGASTAGLRKNGTWTPSQGKSE